MDWKETLLSLAYAILPILGAFLVQLIRYGITYLKNKTESVENEQALLLLLSALDEAETVAVNTVNAIQQQLVDDLKEAHEDGKLTEEEIEMIKERAYATFVSQLSQGSKQILVSSVDNFAEWAKTLIEAKLGAMKRGTEKQVSDLSNPL
jgi:hypothetical protein